MVHHNRRGSLPALALLACIGLAAPAMGLEMRSAPGLGQSGARRLPESADTAVSIKCRGFGSIVNPYDPALWSEPAGEGMPLDANDFAVGIERGSVGYGMIIDPDG